MCELQGAEKPVHLVKHRHSLRHKTQRARLGCKGPADQISANRRGVVARKRDGYHCTIGAALPAYACLRDGTSICQETMPQPSTVRKLLYLLVVIENVIWFFSSTPRIYGYNRLARGTVHTRP